MMMAMRGPLPGTAGRGTTLASRHAGGSPPGGTRSRPAPVRDMADMPPPSPPAEPSGNRTAPAPPARSLPGGVSDGLSPTTAGARADDIAGMASSGCTSLDWLSDGCLGMRKAGVAPSRAQPAHRPMAAPVTTAKRTSHTTTGSGTSPGLRSTANRLAPTPQAPDQPPPEPAIAGPVPQVHETRIRRRRGQNDAQRRYLTRVVGRAAGAVEKVLDLHGHIHRPRGEDVGQILFAVNGESVDPPRSEEHTSELQSRENLVCRLLLEKKNTTMYIT